MRRQQLRPRAAPRLLRAAAATTAQPCALPRPVSFVWRRRRQLSRAPYPALSPSCSSGDDSSAARPAWPRLLRVATTTTARPRALPRPISFGQRRRRQLRRAPCPPPPPVASASAARPRRPPRPVSFVQRRRQQLSRAPCPAPSPSCSGGDDNSAARPAPPRLLCAAAATTAQPCALPRPVSFVWRRRRQLSRAPCLHAPTATTAQPRTLPSCSGSDDSSGRAPHPVSFVQRRRRQLRPRAAPRLLRVATTTTAQDARPAPSPSCSDVLSPTLGDEIVLRLCIPLALKLAYIKVIGQLISFDWSCLEFNMGVCMWTRGVGNKGSGGRDSEGCVCCRSLQYSL